ncbi:hypothetical protein HCN51_43250 [Nonomuraea sp. FMUSA5-5]|uniref:Clp R domain-containing protein n=1 Tax=Nonomuraea composti TaxID=2720023 RepID=A0ABX1BI42_9ACTN|nr:Clp protease N-terminal domain-containing protein [Nonomuraea sp. FMUSA5-5]NJP96179.1 hypothetical protein [Nonomuraea sp. FMUSA5-5]
MFERFTDRARRVIVLSQEEARALHHHHIGTEHLLLGMLREGEAVAAQALESFGIGLDDARRQVVELVGQGAAPASGHLPFTAGATRALQRAGRESQGRGLDHIGTEHLLLGLVLEGEGAGAEALVKLGADLGRVAEVVNEIVARYQAAPPSP